MKTANFFTIILLASTLFVSACARQEFSINGGSGNVARDEGNHFFIGGTFQSQTTNVAEICGGAKKVVSVEAEHTFLNSIISLVSWGIYTPRQYRVICR
ncbi:MAG: lipoprotein bor [Alphaproteobacteria bacterium]|nr:lipoprotein bor [Alphaproteobacteria bacterium]